MKIYKSALLGASILAFAGCQEFEPVLTFKYENPKADIEVEGSNVVADGEIVANTTIADLAALYTQGNPFIIEDDIIIEGRVISNDRPGNFYNEIFIQDETGGISIKIGKNSLYNTYKPGQKVYVKCGPAASSKGLTLGCYGYKTGSGNGMVQLGSEFFKGTYNVEYETNYIRSQHVIDQHVFRGSPEDIVEQVPVVIEEKDLPSKNATLATCPYLGRLVTLKGLKYGGKVFALLYLTGTESTKEATNRVFLSDEDGTWNITTWAMSKTNFLRHLQNGDWDSAEVGSGQEKFGTVTDVEQDSDKLKTTIELFKESIEGDSNFRKTAYYYIYGKYPESDDDPNLQTDELVKKWPRYQLAKNANSYSVSQYFKMGSTEIQLRTSGYSRFADLEIPEEVLSGTATVDLTGVLSLYQGSIQFTVNEIKLTDGKYTEGDVIVNY